MAGLSSWALCSKWLSPPKRFFGVFPKRFCTLAPKSPAVFEANGSCFRKGSVEGSANYSLHLSPRGCCFIKVLEGSTNCALHLSPSLLLGSVAWVVNMSHPYKPSSQKMTHHVVAVGVFFRLVWTYNPVKSSTSKRQVTNQGHITAVRWSKATSHWFDRRRQGPIGPWQNSWQCRALTLSTVRENPEAVKRDVNETRKTLQLIPPLRKWPGQHRDHSWTEHQTVSKQELGQIHRACNMGVTDLPKQDLQGLDREMGEGHSQKRIYLSPRSRPWTAAGRPSLGPYGLGSPSP